MAAALILQATLFSTQAAVTEAWVARYNNVLSNANGVSTMIVPDAAGDVIVTGYAGDGVGGQDMLTIKYSGADGSVRWQRRYNGPANGNDVVQALAVDSNGNVVVAGYSFAGLDTNGFLFLLYDYYTAKYASADGALLWERRYHDTDYTPSVTAVAVDGSGSVVVTGSHHTAKYAAADGVLLWEKHYSGATRAAALDGSGNVVVTGQQSASKYAAADGNLLWEHPYPHNASIAASALDPNGNLVVTGSRSNEWYTAKYAAATGAVLWEKPGGFVMAHDIDATTALAVDRNGNVVVTGYSTTGFQGWGWPVFTEYYTAKYAAANGALLWSRICPLWRGATFDANDNVITDRWGDFAKYASANGALLAEYQFAFAGSANVWDDSGNVTVTGGQFETAKYAAATGALLWHQKFKGPSNLPDSAQAVAVDGSGNVVVTGNSVGFDDGLGSIDYYTVKYAAASGALLWEKRYNGPANHDDIPVAVAVDGVGNVVVTGYSNNESSRDNDFYTAKYGAADGALLWERRYNGPVNDNDRPVALAVDGNGNAIVSGSSYGHAGDETYTAKYAAADGTLLWEQRHPSYGAKAAAVDANGNVVVATAAGRTLKYAAADGSVLWDRPSPLLVLAMAVDGSANVVVTGLENGPAFSYTAKYAAADGALLWEKRSSHYGAGVAVDGSGNVVLIGPSSGNECYTAKFAAEDGALLWEQSSPVEGAAVAVDGRGNVILAGTAGTTNNTFDYYTAKFAPSTGELLWEKRYNGPANGYDLTRVFHPLALGPNGIIAVTGYSSAFSDPAILFGGTSAYDFATVVYRETQPPVMQTSGSNFGVGPAGFGFNIIGTADIPIVVEACTNLAAATWVALQSFNLTNGTVYFSDPNWVNFPACIYRIRSP